MGRHSPDPRDLLRMHWCVSLSYEQTRAMLDCGLECLMGSYSHLCLPPDLAPRLPPAGRTLKLLLGSLLGGASTARPCSGRGQPKASGSWQF